MVMSSTLVKTRAMVAGLLLLGTMMALILLGPIAHAIAATTSVPTLPDDRGYEKVSPNDNADGNVYAAWPLGLANEGGYTYLPYKASPSGNAVAYIGMPSETGGSGREGATRGEQYVARRAANGRWVATNVMPPSDESSTIPAYQGFSEDLSRGVLTTNAGSPLISGAPAEHYRVPYLRDFETGVYESLLPELPPDRGAGEFGAYGISTADSKFEPVLAGGTSDFGHVLYMANDSLTTNASDGGEEDNNLYDFHDATLNLVNLLPDGSPEPNAVFGGPVISSATRQYNSPAFSNVISEDGSRIFWTGQGANDNIYMREGGVRTIQIDAAVGGGGQYWTAAPDGSKVLFTKAGDMYEYDVASSQTTDLTPSGEVQGIVGTSRDLSYVYFVANAVLAAGAKQGTCTGAEQGQECNLYVLHVGEPVRFIATLSAEDNSTGTNSFRARSGDWQGGFVGKESEVTPDGHEVLFNSQGEELFVYEFISSKLRCVSCSPSGGGAFLPVSYQPSYQLHWMSDDGSRVFFDSTRAVVPQDTNGLSDVYEWERDGSGSCESSEGCIYLLTGGTGGEGAFMIDSSASGDDVFFTSRAQLVAEDQNENIDVYDAHVDAVIPPVAPQCTGTGCQGLPSAPPVFSTPSSVTYDGVGNFTPPPSIATKAKKAKAKKKSVKKDAKRRKRSGKSKKAKKSSQLNRDKGGSRVHGLAVSNGRSK